MRIGLFILLLGAYLVCLIACPFVAFSAFVRRIIGKGRNNAAKSPTVEVGREIRIDGMWNLPKYRNSRIPTVAINWFFLKLLLDLLQNKHGVKFLSEEARVCQKCGTGRGFYAIIGIGAASLLVRVFWLATGEGFEFDNKIFLSTEAGNALGIRDPQNLPYSVRIKSFLVLCEEEAETLALIGRLPDETEHRTPAVLSGRLKEELEEILSGSNGGDQCEA